MNDYVAFARALEYPQGDPEREELYTRTFDLAPERALEAGYHLFGESYKRGIFLVKMQAALREHGVDAGAELPDYIPHLLRLLEKQTDPERARLLADEVLLPALSRILAALGDSPYRDLLLRLRGALQADFSIAAIRPVPGDGLFPVLR